MSTFTECLVTRLEDLTRLSAFLRATILTLAAHGLLLIEPTTVWHLVIDLLLRFFARIEVFETTSEARML